MSKNNKGFTLVELLIVISVIAIMASIVLIPMGVMRKKARDSKRVTELRNVQNMLELYYERNGQYPTTAGASAAARWTDLTTALTSISGITNIPKDPLSGYSYDYKDLGGSQQEYVLGAKLEFGGGSILDNDIDTDLSGSGGPNCADTANSGPDSWYCVRM